jgi:hypothetical protein
MKTKKHDYRRNGKVIHEEVIYAEYFDVPITQLATASSDRISSSDFISFACGKDAFGRSDRGKETSEKNIGSSYHNSHWKVPIVNDGRGFYSRVL